MLSLLFSSYILGAFAGVTNCGTASTKFTITELSQNPPDTIQAGQNLSLLLKYTSYEEVSEGSVTTSLTYNFIPISPTITPLCTSIICPLAPGDHDGSTSEVFPTGLAGTVTSKIVWTDINSNQLLCINSKLSVKN